VRTYKASGIYHKVYDDRDELPPGVTVVGNWRKAMIGDWVEADDGCIIQILRRGEMRAPRRKKKVSVYIGTCTGTFLCNSKATLDTARRENIWSISGKDTERVLFDRENLTKHEILFVQFIAGGVKLQDAYLKAFKTNNGRYAAEQSAKLVKTERIQKAMKEELKPVLKELGIDDMSVLKGIKEVAQGDEKAETRLKALFKLSDILDLEDKTQTKITQLSGAIFQGFSDDVIEGVQRPIEIENK